MSTNPLKRLWASILPIIGMLVFAVLFVLGLFISFYLLIIAAIVALVLFVIAFVRLKFMGRKARPQRPSHGRTIEQDENDKDH